MNPGRRRGDTPGLDHLAGDSEMSTALRAHDWEKTPLGPPEAWPQSLKTLTRIVLSSGYPSFVWWGPDLININNDAYLPALGKKHPASIGASAASIWPEIWDVVGPLAERVLQTGQSVWQERMQLFMNRKGYLEETYFTFSYSPATDDQGRVAGVYCTCFDDTAVVLGERRLAALRTLATELVDVREQSTACKRAISALRENRNDLPFVALYLRESGPEGETGGLKRMAISGLPEHSTLCPSKVTEDHPFAASMMQMLPLTGCEDEAALATIFDGTSEAMAVIPLPADPGAVSPGVLIAGVSPYRAMDEDYEGFLELVARGVATGITTARTSEAERRRAAALAELDRAKTLFFSDVSHEFRTPLTLILGPLQDALGQSGASLPRRELKIVYRNALRLLKLVNTLLDFARIEAGRTDALYEPVELGGFTADLASLFRSATDSAGLEFKVNCTPLAEPIFIDREMWEKIVLNLISNAIKFTFSGGITVAVEEAADHVNLIVEDTGVGIRQDDIPKLFKRFHRIRAARSRAHEGSGIGLALVDELVRLHQGTITVESEPDRGTRFCVRLSKGRKHLPQERIGEFSNRTHASGAALYVEEAQRWFPSGTSDEFPNPEKPAPDFLQSERRTHTPTNERILLVDDNRDMRDYLVSLLTDYDVVAVGDGETALKAASTESFSLVLTDVMLPRMDGLELTRALRADPALHDTPVIMLSARAGESARVEGLEAGADIYLAKPFSARELLAHVAGQVRLAALRAQVTESYRLADERKDEFLATLGHELRNPLAALHSATELIQHGGADDLAYAHSVLSANVSSLTRLVDDLLDVARLTRGKVTLRREPVKLGRLVRRIAQSVYAEAAEPRPALRISADDTLPVEVDPVRLEQIVSNLLTNSLRHTPADGSIEIRIVRQTTDNAQEVALEVQDSGQGIPEENLSKIFDPFWQPVERSARGLGVGLAIVKQLVALHGGTVRAASDGVGCGSTFTVTLPLIEPTTTKSSQPTQADVDPLPLQGRRVLLVDDNRDLAIGITRLLEKMGAEVGVAYDGAAGIEAAAEPWDVVILDVGLPDMEGTEVARRIRALSTGGPGLLVALTGYSDSGTQQRIVEAGFDQHLVKPIDTETLQRLICGQ